MLKMITSYVTSYVSSYVGESEVLTHLSPIDFPALINWPSPCQF